MNMLTDSIIKITNTCFASTHSQNTFASQYQMNSKQQEKPFTLKRVQIIN